VTEPLRQQSDADLVRAVQAGPTHAFGELYRRHYPSVRRACVRRLGDTAEADRAAEETFAQALEHIDECDRTRRFGPWVHVIAQRLCAEVGLEAPRAEPEPDVEWEPEIEPEPEVAAGDEEWVAPEAVPAAVPVWVPPEPVVPPGPVVPPPPVLRTLSRRQRDAIVARAMQAPAQPETAEPLGDEGGEASDETAPEGRLRRLGRLARRRREGKEEG
jgi:hypothetical protein